MGLKNKIYQGDFFKLYRRIEPRSVTLFLADLPYGVHTDKRLKDIPDSSIDLIQLEQALDYLLADNGIALLFANFKLLIALISSFGEYLAYKWHHVVVKSCAMPTNQYRPINDVEFLGYFRRLAARENRVTFNPWESGRLRRPYIKKNSSPDIPTRNIKKSKATRNRDGRRWIRSAMYMNSRCNLPKRERQATTHPFQKSVTLLRTLIRVYSQPGDLVVDGFAGSGSTLVAAQLEGRHSVGFELNKKFYLEAIQRAKIEGKQITSNESNGLKKERNLMRLLTTQETADLLRVTTRTVFNYIKEGRLKPVKIGRKPGGFRPGKVLIPQDEVDKLIAESE